MDRDGIMKIFMKRVKGYTPKEIKNKYSGSNKVADYLALLSDWQCVGDDIREVIEQRSGQRRYSQPVATGTRLQ